MSHLLLTEGAPTAIGNETASDSQRAAEQFARLRQAVKSSSLPERKEAAAALVECGSSAVFPLLRLVEDDEDYEVAVMALWSLLRLTDDLLCGKSEERDSPGAILERKRVTNPYLRLGLEAVVARSTGESPANTAYAWVHRLGPGSHDVGLRFLGDLVRQAPDLDPQLPDVLRRMARRHPLPWIRPNGARLLREYEAWAATGELPPAAKRARSLSERRLAVQLDEGAGEITLERLMTAAALDPDRTVRHRAGARLYHLVRKGAVVRTPEGLPFKDEEIRYLFLEGHGTLQVHPNPAESLKRVADRSPRARRCVLRFLAPLRPFVDDCNRAEMDFIIRTAMRDSEREVRRDASEAARAATSGVIGEELAGRLRERLRFHPPIAFAILIVMICVSLPVSFMFMKVWWIKMIPQFLTFGLHLYSYGRYRTGKHGITHEECLETLVAMEPIAERSPEKLIASVPDLRKLAGLGVVDAEVRAKARKLLAKVHEATLHELPIAATEPAVAPEALPIPASQAPSSGVNRRRR